MTNSHIQDVHSAHVKSPTMTFQPGAPPLTIDSIPNYLLQPFTPALKYQRSVRSSLKHPHIWAVCSNPDLHIPTRRITRPDLRMQCLQSASQRTKRSEAVQLRQKHKQEQMRLRHEEKSIRHLGDRGLHFRLQNFHQAVRHQAQHLSRPWLQPHLRIHKRRQVQNHRQAGKSVASRLGWH